MPNFIVYTSIIPKLFGAKVILDLHDPSPEIFLSLSEKGYDSLMYKIALFEEKISIWFADHIITTNIAFRELFISRGCKENKISIVMNSPQTSIFNDVKIATTEKNKTPQKFRIMYNGTIIKRHGLDILVDAVYLLKDKITNIELNIYGDGEFLTEVMTKVKSLKISDFIKYRGSFLVDIIAEEIPKMDIGVIPNRLNVFTNLNFPIRVFEFIHFKKPIVVPQTKGIGDYFDEDSIFYFQPEIVNDLAEVILAIYNKSLDVEDIINNGYKVYQNNTWEIQSSILNQVYNKLIKLS
jgi:glycosyltransferase involved in cell wall biosynthesis